MDARHPHLHVRVETYAGHRADESPRAFTLGTRRVSITEELDRWLDPRHRYFKVRGDDGHVYILRHDVLEDSWELTLFSAGGGPCCDPCLCVYPPDGLRRRPEPQNRPPRRELLRGGVVGYRRLGQLPSAWRFIPWLG